MLYLSEVLMKNHEMSSFEELKVALKGEARQGQMFFEMDVKPGFTDTPTDWQDQCEAAFTSRD
ncbi:MAG: sulfur relay protein DsrC [Gammaproteobacteria bacterium]|nr:sulfur relay protein DsrC [Gammaproteobacteria bacterium]